MTQQNPPWMYPPPAQSEFQQGGQNINQWLTNLFNGLSSPQNATPWNAANQGLTSFFNQLGRGNPTQAFNSLNQGLTGAGNQQAVVQRLMQMGATPQQITQLMQRAQTQAPFQEPQGPWNMQTPPAGVGSGQPGAAWQPGYQQGRPASWNAPQGMGPTGPGGAQGGAQNPNGGPWWTDPYGNQSFSGFDWNQTVPWGNAQYTPGGPSPFAGQPVGAWEDITNNLRTMGYLDQQAFNNQQQGVQNNQWDQTFGANQAQQGVQNSQWDRNFNQQGSQWDRNFNANQAQQGIQNGQWDRNFNAQQGQQGWQNTFNQNEANRAADQWGQTFGANQAQQGWNNQYQTGRANAADSQWGQTFGANESQRGIENTRNAALDQWNQAFSQAGFDWKKQQDAEQNRLQDQGQNLAAFGRRFGPNVSYM